MEVYAATSGSQEELFETSYRKSEEILEKLPNTRITITILDFNSKIGKTKGDHDQRRNDVAYTFLLRRTYLLLIQKFSTIQNTNMPRCHPVTNAGNRWVEFW